MMRDDRQKQISAWTKQAFGIAEATSLPQRGLRLLEESIEAYQACGGDVAMAHKLVDFVFGRPSGEVGQELGGVQVCVLALAAAAGLSAEGEERREVERVLAKPVEHFAERNAAKNAAGFRALPLRTRMIDAAADLADAAEHCRMCRECGDGPCCSECRNEAAVARVRELMGAPINVGEVSDGHHTFNELYDHRITLFIALCAHVRKYREDYRVWRSRIHSDGSALEGWFVVGIGTEPGKQVTYHLPLSRWAETDAVVDATFERAPEFDGHTSRDVLARLRQLHGR